MRRKKRSDAWLLLLALLGLGAWGGEKPEEPPKPEPKEKPPAPSCDPGYHPEWIEDKPGGLGLTLPGVAEGPGGHWECVKDAPGVEPCPPGQVRNENGECVDKPKVIQIPECPPGQERNAEGECVDKPKVIEKPTGPTDPGLDDPKIINPYPTPASYYPVKAGDSEFARAREYVASCLYLGAKEVLGYDHAAALAYASQHNTPKARMNAVAFWSCVPENDRDYGTFAFTKCKFTGDESGCTWPGPNGRGIRFVHNGGNSQARMRGGQAFRRAVLLGKPGGAPSSWSGVDAAEREYPIPWMPEPDYGALIASNGETWLPSTAKWSDGVSRFRPPPAFRKLLWIDVSGSDRTIYGCAPNEVDFG